MANETVTLDKKQIDDLRKRFPQAQVRKTPPYAFWQIKLSDCVITAYESGKVVFQGEGATFHASSYQSALQHKVKADVNNRKILYPQAGSDEVGTGDYFGPITVCAAYVEEKDVPFLKELGIQDSKAIDDAAIRKMAPQLMERLVHSLLILDNATYNRIHSTENMVAIKSKLHNQAYVHLERKLGKLPSFCVIDQFVQGKSYYRYLKEEPQVIRNIHFETKAENKYLSVACGSVIARYAFLRSFDKMCEHYDFAFLKGAGAKVDANIREFVKLHGKEPLYGIAKLHFANTRKALGEDLV